MLSNIILRAVALLALASATQMGWAGPMVVKTPTGTLAGTLELPTTRTPCPLVLFIAGSGPTDRDGNTLALGARNDSLKLLAQGLAAQGIASLRYDKRGVGGSADAAVPEVDLRVPIEVNDAVAWCQLLRRDARFSRLFIIGHSEGSLIGMLTAQRVHLDGFVSLAGVGQPAANLLREQLKPKLPSDLWQSSQKILQRLEAGKTTDNVPAVLSPLFRSSVQPYLISWFRYDPAQELKKLKVPLLLVQGTTDIQVQLDELTRLAKAAPGAQCLRIKGMNHVLKMVSADTTEQMRSYRYPSFPVAPQLVSGITRFVRAHA